MDQLDTASPESLLHTLRTSTDTEEVRHAAIRLGDEQVIEALDDLVAMLRHPQLVLRDAAALALRDLRDQRALHPLADAVRAEPGRCGTFLYALQTLDCRPIVEFLVELFIDSGPSVRTSVSGCLETIDAATLPADVLARIRSRLQRAAHDAEPDSADLEQLEWLLGLLRP